MAGSPNLLRAWMLAGVAVSGLVTGLAAPSQAAAQPTSPAAPAAPSGQGSTLEEIVVTAQRRAENLQEVPIAVAAVTAQALENAGISATNNLPQIVPSVQMTRSGPSGLFFIRGVGTTNAAAGEEGANAVYVDGVYMPDLGQSINYFNNIARIEVLKGPQGTLFGRNATGGLIHIITRDPGEEFEARGQVGFANYSTIAGQLYVGGPVANNISADLALTGSNQDDGWGRNLTRNEDIKIQQYFGARSKIVFRPSEELKFTLTGDYFENDDNLGLAWRLEDGVLGSAGQVGPGGQDTTSNYPSLTSQRNWGLSFTAEADLGFANLTSITAYRKARNHSFFDVDGARLDLINIDYVSRTKSIQQEIRLASKSTEPLSWQVGGFYLRSEASTDQHQRGLAFAAAPLRSRGSDILASLTTDSYAAFGEATYAITPSTRLTVGARYTEDQRELESTVTGLPLAGTPTVTPRNDELSYSEWSYRVALRQDITEDINVYASVNRGFKAGSYSLQSPLNPAVLPQFIMAYEVGLKSEWFDRRLRVNLSAYHYDIDDYQVRSAAVASPGSSVLLNAATVSVDGFDLEFEAAPTREWRIFGGFTALKSEFEKFGGPGERFQAPIVYPSPATCRSDGTADLGTGPRTGGFVTCFGDVAGNKTPLAPDFAGSLGVSYNRELDNDASVRASLLYNYNSGYVFEPDNRFEQEAFSLLNASIEYWPNDRFGVQLWVNNLTDEEYAVQKLTTATGTTTALGAPRTYGVNFRFEF